MNLITHRVEVIDHEATGQRFRAAREAAKISLREMARRLGMSAPYVSDLELGRRNWTQDKADRFAAIIEQNAKRTCAEETNE